MYNLEAVRVAENDFKSTCSVAQTQILHSEFVHHQLMYSGAKY